MEFINYVFVMYIFLMSPGPSMALISRNSAKFGLHRSHFTILGILTSISFYSLLSLLGVNVLIALYPNAFKICKMIGSSYIIYLGVKIFWSTFKQHKGAKGKVLKEQSHLKQYLSGLFTDLANPLNIVGVTSIILGFIKVDDSLQLKAIYFFLTILTAICYAYSYAFLFGNPVSKKFIEPRLFLFERIAGIMVAIIGCIFFYNTINF